MLDYNLKEYSYIIFTIILSQTNLSNQQIITIAKKCYKNSSLQTRNVVLSTGVSDTSPLFLLFVMLGYLYYNKKYNEPNHG